MKNILKLLYDISTDIQEKDSLFVRTARIKNENMEMLNASMTDEQKDLLEAYFDADTKIEGIMHFDRFR